MKSMELSRTMATVPSWTRLFAGWRDRRDRTVSVSSTPLRNPSSYSRRYSGDDPFLKLFIRRKVWLDAGTQLH
ncbi:hypothetical protein GUJ93_ZPchr0006g44005 [Zizania palustris]|uniref:Uncharacterized protein n=1 Tax=Zizania palustris TaxID=103762 RepID=A0A8J5SYC7_ZIZPA|nr:hypothetical protein GUJ93_ZPchr0006g44005 [Zizania palustris]